MCLASERCATLLMKHLVLEMLGVLNAPFHRFEQVFEINE